ERSTFVYCCQHRGISTDVHPQPHESVSNQVWDVQLVVAIVAQQPIEAGDQIIVNLLKGALTSPARWIGRNTRKRANFGADIGTNIVVEHGNYPSSITLERQHVERY